MRPPASARLIPRKYTAGARGHLAATLAGCALPLSFAPLDWWPVGLLSIALLLLSLDGADPRTSTIRQYLYGVGMYGTGVSWIYVSIHEHGHASPLLSFVLVSLFVLSFSLVSALHGYLYGRFFNRSDLGVALGFPAMWVAQEWFRTWFLTGFPWLFLGYGYFDTPIVHYAPIVGVLGVSFIAALTVSVALVASRNLRRRRWSTAAAAIALLWAGGIAIEDVWVEPSRDVTIGVVQANVDQQTKWAPSKQSSIVATYERLSEAAWGRDLVVWPEAAIPAFLDQAEPYLADLGQRATSSGSAVLLGIPRRDALTGAYYNSAIAIGEGDGVYTKRRLVPFGEYVPLEGLLRGLIRFFDLPMSHNEPGAPRQAPLIARGLRVATSICYEVVYPDLVQGSARDADILLTISNDTWFGDSLGPMQHMQMARMRALENGRAMIRSTNNGVTALVNHRGEIVGRLPQFAEGVLTGSLTVMTGRTPFVALGSVPVILLVSIILVGLLIEDARRSGRVRSG